MPSHTGSLRRLGMRLVAVSDDLASFLTEGLGVPRSALKVVHNGIPVPPLPEPGDALSVGQGARRARPSGGRCARRRGRQPLSGEGPRDARRSAGACARTCASQSRAEARRSDASATGASARGPERLHLLGLRDDVDRVLRAGDVFVHPSRLEGLPLAILEAMAAGLPVVASRVGGIPEAVMDGETGVLVAPGDVDALASALRRVLETAGLASALGTAGRTRAERFFSVEAMVSAYRRLYGE